MLRPAGLLPSLARAFDTPLRTVGSLLPPGVCFRALRRLPGQDFHLLEQRVFQDAPHPRFYWGEAGNVLTPSLFKLPIPASRALVPTGYGYVLPDQNGWSRYLHFQSAWIVVLTGLLYAVSGLFTGHFRKNLLPDGADLSWRALSIVIANHMRFE